MTTIAPPLVPSPDKVRPDGCVCIIGMAAAGKTTIGREVAHLLDWAHADTDHLIEAHYGVPLQHLADKLTKDEFLDLEADVISRITMRRVVISTGGSAIYRPGAIEHLQTLGPIVYIAVPLPIILERVARRPDRGLAIAPGQTVEDLYYERAALYDAVATHTVTGGQEPAVTYARQIADWLVAPK